MGCPWDFPGKNTGVGSHFFLQGIFPTRESNLWLLLSLVHCGRVLYHWAIILSCLTVFLSFCLFFTSLMKFILRLKFFYGKDRRRTWAGAYCEKASRVVLSYRFISSFPYAFWTPAETTTNAAKCLRSTEAQIQPGSVRLWVLVTQK